MPDKEVENLPQWYINKKKRDAVYKKQHVKRKIFEFNKNTDADILEKLESVPNVQGYVKKLIRDDIKNGLNK